jgi:hypothetical protein
MVNRLLHFAIAPGLMSMGSPDPHGQRPRQAHQRLTKLLRYWTKPSAPADTGDNWVEKDFSKALVKATDLATATTPWANRAVRGQIRSYPPLKAPVIPAYSPNPAVTTTTTPTIQA